MALDWRAPKEQIKLMDTLEQSQNERTSKAVVLQDLANSDDALRARVVLEMGKYFTESDLAAIDSHIDIAGQILAVRIFSNPGLFAKVAGSVEVGDHRRITATIRASEIAILVANYRAELEAALAV